MATPSALALASIRLAVATQLRQPDPRTLICFMALPPLSDQGIEQIADADEGDGQIETEPRQALQLDDLAQDDEFGHRNRHHAHHQHRSEEHTSELQSLMRISYAVFCLKKKKNKQININNTNEEI